MYFGSFCFRGELGFLKCDYMCIHVVNKLFEFVFNSVYLFIYFILLLNHTHIRNMGYNIDIQ